MCEKANARLQFSGERCEVLHYRQSLDELKLILKQHDKAFDCLTKEADKRSNGDESLRGRILTELVVHNFRRKLAKKEKLLELLPRVPKKPRTRRPLVKPINGIGLELGSGFPRENHNKKGTSQSMVNDEDRKSKKKKPRISTKEAERLREWGSKIRLPEDVRARMEELGGADPVLVITKYLYETDMSIHHGRLSLPLRQLAGEVHRFLSPSEWKKIASNKDKTIKARLVGPSWLDPTDVFLKCWWMSNAPYLVIASGWAGFLSKYKNEHAGGVKKGDAIQVWASRGRDDVVLALVVLEPAVRCPNEDVILIQEDE